MFCVAVPAGQVGLVSIYCPVAPGNAYIPWKGLKQAKRLTVRIDSKHAVWREPYEKRVGT